MRKINLLWLLLMAASVSSCGSTKVVVDKPAQGTQTTITVTTNNPITTEVNPQTEMEVKK